MSIPSIPVPGSNLAAPLVTAAQYKQITGDGDSNGEDVAEAISEATFMIEQECHRTLAYGQYKENLYLYALGMVFPSAPPVDRTKPVSSGVTLYDPTTDNQAGEGSIIQGAGIWVGWFTPLPWMPVWTGVIPPQTNITYWGGFYPYQDVTDTVTTATLPPKLARMICKIAYYTLHPVGLSGLPGGAKSMSVGGVNVNGDLSSFMMSDPQLKRDIRRWRRPQAHAWET